MFFNLYRSENILNGINNSSVNMKHV